MSSRRCTSVRSAESGDGAGPGVMERLRREGARRTGFRKGPQAGGTSGEALEGLGGGLVDRKELVELGDDEDLVDLRVDVGQAELASDGADAVVDRDQRAQRRRGQVVHVRE